MRMTYLFDAAPWLGADQRAAAETLFRQLRRTTLKAGAHRTPLLNLEIAELVLNWCFLQEMRGAVLAAARTGDGGKALPVNGPLLDQLDQCRERFLKEREAAEEFVHAHQAAPAAAAAAPAPAPSAPPARATRAAAPPQSTPQPRANPLGFTDDWAARYEGVTVWEPGMPMNLLYRAGICRRGEDPCVDTTRRYCLLTGKCLDELPQEAAVP